MTAQESHCQCSCSRKRYDKPKKLSELPEWAQRMFKNDKRTSVISNYQPCMDKRLQRDLWARTLYHAYWGLKIHVVCTEDYIGRNVGICKDLIDDLGMTDEYEIDDGIIHAIDGGGMIIFGPPPKMELPVTIYIDEARNMY